MYKKIVVGMSGGVDSSTAALLLKKAGYEVIGVTMRMWQDDDCTFDAGEDAARVCAMLGIEHHVLDFREDFRKNVIDYFTREYLSGRTPNPCIACNRTVKWEALLEKSREFGAGYIATGHYAKIMKLPNGRYTVAKAAAAEKDQSYALYRLTQEQLAHTVMPLGEYTKPQVRAMAQEAGLPVAQKAESQEICFIPDNDHASFIERTTGEKLPEGNFVTEDGRILGRHKGITHYTIGQRRGLEIAMGRRVFVKEIRTDTNEVVISDTGDVFSKELKAGELNFCGIEDLAPGEEGRFIGKIRYGHRGAPCTVTRSGADEITAVFDEPVRAVTPGQSFVFYKDGYVAGGGTIL